MKEEVVKNLLPHHGYQKKHFAISPPQKQLFIASKNDANLIKCHIEVIHISTHFQRNWLQKVSPEIIFLHVSFDPDRDRFNLEWNKMRNFRSELLHLPFLNLMLKVWQTKIQKVNTNGFSPSKSENVLNKNTWAEFC